MSGTGSQLEGAFTAWLGCGGGVAAGFGRAALRLGLEAAGCAGADVLVPDFVCAQVPHAVRRAGARPVFYPVPRHLSVAPADFAAALTPATRAAVAVHYFGRVQPAIRALASVCRERGIALVEDCALALGASLDGQRAGTFGDLAVFSFTKSEWCYGGGLMVAREEPAVARARRIRDAHFSAARRLGWKYGLLRRIDFAANRPRWARLAERAGAPLQSLAGLPDANFYDAGRFDALLPGFAARRALRILRRLESDRASRASRHRRLGRALAGAAGAMLWPPDDGETCAFLPLVSASGRAHAGVHEAAREGVTLRLSWPAYQPREPGQGSPALDWLADHLMLLEVHPQLDAGELERITACLRRLAGRA